MTLDPRIAMALAVQAHKGVYAVLLGSGVSRSAGIPTGWEVVLELVGRVALAEQADTAGDPEKWYRTRFKKEPNYSDVVKMVAPKRSERQSLLKGFFEPTEQERQEGKKQPTPAHKALAQLVAKGYVRIIITTNFDRLMERALEEVGVSPSVVSTPDQIAGMVPPQHTGCIVVKVHGDYLDTRLRNTTDELEKYEPETDGLLSRILTEYGLIVCGWSADWDTALADSVTRGTNHRFSTFWMQRGNLGRRADEVCKHRQAVIVKIESADEVLPDLLDKIGAIESQTVADPVSAAVSIASMKRFLGDPFDNRIRIEELIMGEARRAQKKTDRSAMPEDSPEPVPKSYLERVARIEAAMNALVPMAAVGVKWGGKSLYPLWGRAITLLARDEVVSGTSYNWWSYLRRYPATLLVYAIGVVAVTIGDYNVLRSILVETKLPEKYGGDPKPVVHSLWAAAALYYDAAQSFYDLKAGSKRKTPGSDHIQLVLSQVLADFFDHPTDFIHAFDRFEMVLALTAAGHGEYPPIGCFGWRREMGEGSFEEFAKEIEAQGPGHPVIALGSFASMEKFKEARTAVAKAVTQVRWGS